MVLYGDVGEEPLNSLLALLTGDVSELYYLSGMWHGNSEAIEIRLRRDRMGPFLASEVTIAPFHIYSYPP